MNCSRKRTCSPRRTFLVVFPLAAALLALRPSFAQEAAKNEPAAAAAPIKRVRNVTYARPAGRALKAELFLPAADGPHPGVLVVHGGAWRVGNRHQLSRAAERLAAAGYAAVAIDYRLAPEFKYPAQIEDCQTAVRWMRRTAKTYRIDPDRIGGYGYSAGGHLVALLGALDEPPNHKISARLQAVVAGGAPLNFELLPATSDLLAFWLGGTRRDKPRIYRQASPTTHVSADDPPMFFFHGERDILVPSVSPQAMALLLAAKKVEAKVELIRGAGHIEAMFDEKALEASVKFLDARLKPKPG